MLCGNNYAEGQSASNVLVVINDVSQASRRIGEDYIAQRRIPAECVPFAAKTDETVERADFDTDIQAPIARCISTASAQDCILIHRAHPGVCRCAWT